MNKLSELRSLPDALAAARHSQRGITFIDDGETTSTLSYAELYTRAHQLLGALQTQGLGRGDQLILLTKDNRRFIELFWAALLGGLVPVPVAVGNNDQHRAKLFQVFAALERPYVYTDAAVLERLRNYAEQQRLDDAFGAVLTRTVLDDALQSDDTGAGQVHQPAPEDTAFIQFSSGSTSDPKGVVLSHANILSNLAAIAAGAAYREQDTSLSWMPLTHDMGLIGFHLNMVACRMQQCIMATDLFSRRPLLWLQKAAELGATVLCSPNFGYKHFLKVLGDKTLPGLDLSRVRLLYNGAEPIAVDLCEEFLQRLAPYGLARTTMFTVYGLAEASLAVAFPALGAPYQTVYVDRHAMRVGDAVRPVQAGHADAVGFAVEGRAVIDCEIRITGADHTALEPGKIGHIQMRGRNVTRGYYRNDAANAAALTADGWFDTGDLGFLTTERELVVTGRSKDIVFANGQNYYPHDLEGVAVGAHDGLELGKVVACGVRRPGADADELLVFVLFRKEPDVFLPIAEAVMRHLNEQTGLVVSHVVPVNRIPKTTSGKLQRGALGARYLEGEFDDVLGSLADLRAAAVAPAPVATADASLHELQQQLQQICASVVSDRVIGVHDNLFDLGISSLTLAEIHQQIDERYPGIVDITDLFEYPSLAEIAGFMTQKLSSSG